MAIENCDRCGGRFRGDHLETVRVSVVRQGGSSVSVEQRQCDTCLWEQFGVEDLPTPPCSAPDPYAYVCERCGSDDVRAVLPAWVRINTLPALLSVEELDVDADPLYDGAGLCDRCGKERDGDDECRVVLRVDRESERDAGSLHLLPPSDGDENGQWGDDR